ncbi:MAG TPA: T9SS type A sorting domain-containing protein [Bacteroidales bacterium]|nr:T9SS type A sorting domain-containing protein [Bacteroidales bacterium]
MKKVIFTFAFLVIALCCDLQLKAQDKLVVPAGYQVQTWIDNIGYWQNMAKLGLVPVEPLHRVAPAHYTGSKVWAKGVLIADSPDIPVTTDATTTQSENSTVVSKVNKLEVLNSNNSTPEPSNGSVYGADYYYSLDGAETWEGSKQGAGTSNSGDPAACINLSGRYFVGYITNGGDQGVSYTDDRGLTWHTSIASNAGSSFNILDKNHLWVDNGPASPYQGNLYDGWMHNSGSPAPIHVARSIDNGASWEPDQDVSAGANAGHHNQGVNIKTGPNGEVYVCWAVYDGWPADEKAIGFNKSTDGGISYGTAIRAINNIRGIRNSGVSKNQRTNSFPSMTVDLSNGPRHGWIYIVWTNHGVPGVNSGNDIDCYMIRSTDGGTTWSAAIRINQDPSGQGKQHYFPWICCDQTSGELSVVFYDDREVTSSQCETYMAYSDDGGSTWTDMKVSDVSWTPSPIPLMATGYMGDYLGIDAYDGKVYPTWTDNRLGYCMTYVSPIDLVIPKSTIIYNGNQINDATYGNGNGKMDFGETELLDLTMQNTGTLAADSVWVTLQCSSPYITITDSTEFYGHFDIGQSITKNDAYQFNVSNNIPDGTLVEFTTRSVDSQDTVTYSHFYIEAHAPAVTILSMAIHDPNGNNNGQLDPGETATIDILTQNTGEFDAVDAVSELTSSNPFCEILTPTINLGTLAPGQTVHALFNVQVNAWAAIGTATTLHNYVHSIYDDDNKDFVTKIGLIVEDWETGDFTKFPWTFNGDAPWVIVTHPGPVFEGTYSSGTGHILDSQTSGLVLQYDVMYDDTISFWRKTSTQILSDNLKFFIDSNNVGSWNGVKDWVRIAVPVLAGPHTFTWKYEKDPVGSGNADSVWVDFIVFPPESITNIFAGDDAAVCAGSAYQLKALAVNYDSLYWSTSGTGVFSDPNIADPIYTPSAQDITAGSVTLTLQAFEAGVLKQSDDLLLTIVPAPMASAGPDATVCSQSTFAISGANASGYQTLLWSTSGDGTFSDPTLVNPVYKPGPQDVVNGTARLFLNLTGDPVCGTVSDSLDLTVLAAPVVNLGQDTSICANKTYTLDATTAGASSYLWLPSGATTATIVVDSTGVGLGTQAYIAEVTGTNGCVGTDTVNVTYKDCTGIPVLQDVEFNIFPNPNPGVFTIQGSSSAKEILNIVIINAAGQPVYTLDKMDVFGNFSRKMDLSQLSAGTYLMQISGSTGMLIRKLVIRK